MSLGISKMCHFKIFAVKGNCHICIFWMMFLTTFFLEELGV